jgi:uncharacterized membrane protein HdeD (DUF308 family)
MTSLSPGYNQMQSAIAVGTHWRLFLFEGAIIIILGILAIAAPAAAPLTVEVYLGWILLLAGIAGYSAVFSVRDITSFLSSLIPAAPLSIVVGALLLWRPEGGALSLTVLLIAFFITEAVFQIAMSITYRDVIGGSWGWILVSGVCDVVLAAMIILAWPTTAGWALCLLVGMNLITSGGAIIMAALAGRDVVRTATLTNSYRGRRLGF